MANLIFHKYYYLNDPQPDIQGKLLHETMNLVNSRWRFIVYQYWENIKKYHNTLFKAFAGERSQIQLN